MSAVISFQSLKELQAYPHRSDTINEKFSLQDDTNTLIYANFDEDFRNIHDNAPAIINGGYSIEVDNPLVGNTSVRISPESRNHIKWSNSENLSQGTIEVVFKPEIVNNVLGSAEYIVQADFDIYAYWGMYTLDNNTFRVQHVTDLGDTYYLDSNFTLIANETYHLAYTWGPQGQEIWVNGLLTANNPSITSGLHSNIHYYGIGNTHTASSTQAALGTWDEFRVSNLQRDVSLYINSSFPEYEFLPCGLIDEWGNQKTVSNWKFYSNYGSELIGEELSSYSNYDILSEYEGRENVLKIWDTHSNYFVDGFYPIQPQSTGRVEYWMNIAEGQDALIRLRTTAINQEEFYIRFLPETHQIQQVRQNTVNYINYTQLPIAEWMKITIDFDCFANAGNGSYDLFINEQFVCSGLSRTNFNAVEYIQIANGKLSNPSTIFFDHFACSWIPFNATDYNHDMNEEPYNNEQNDKYIFVDDENTLILAHFENNLENEHNGNDAVTNGGWTYDLDEPLVENASVQLAAENRNHIKWMYSENLVQGTIEVIFRPTQVSNVPLSSEYILQADYNVYAYWGMYTLDDNSFRVQHVTESGEVFYLDSNYTLEANETYHLAYTWGPRGQEIWVNGNLTAANVEFTGSLHSNIMYYGIGNTHTASNTQACMGTWDEFRVSNIQRFNRSIFTPYREIKVEIAFDDQDNFTTDHPINFQVDISGGVPPYTLGWDFGDNHYSSEGNVSHHYETPGIYTILLTVLDSNQTIKEITFMVIISEDSGNVDDDSNKDEPEDDSSNDDMGNDDGNSEDPFTNLNIPGYSGGIISIVSVMLIFTIVRRKRQVLG